MFEIEYTVELQLKIEALDRAIADEVALRKKA
jgi:hypothetical protein